MGALGGLLLASIMASTAACSLVGISQQSTRIQVSCAEMQPSELQVFLNEVETSVGGLVEVRLCTTPSTAFGWEAPEMSDAVSGWMGSHGVR